MLTLPNTINALHNQIVAYYMCGHLLCHPTIEGKAIPELKDKNKAASLKWHDMSGEEKQQYYQLASQVPSVSSPSHNMYKWHETQRVLSNLQENVK